MSRTWLDRNKYFPEFIGGTFTRDDMSREREREWVDFCYEAYEADGFKKTFGDEYTGDREYRGKRFTVIGRVPEFGRGANEEDGADLECLPMWNIKFEDGTIIAAYPEEICLSETPEYRKKNAEAFRDLDTKQLIDSLKLIKERCKAATTCNCCPWNINNEFGLLPTCAIGMPRFWLLDESEKQKFQKLNIPCVG